MTVPYLTPAALEFIGNNTANTFSITFPTFEDGNVEASVSDVIGNTTDLVVATDFTLANIGVAKVNASLTLVSGKAWMQGANLKTGYKLHITFNPVAFQPGSFRNLGRFAPEQFEKVLDRITMSILAVNDKADKAVSLQLGDGSDGVIPPLTGNALKILQVNAAATGFEYGVTSATIESYKTSATASAAAAEVARLAAVAAQTASGVSAAAALTSKNQSSTSAGASAVSAAASSTSASGAGVSEAAAAVSATNAQTAAATATTKASQALASANAAAASAAAASTAEGFKNQAATSASASATSAGAAATSAAASASSATDANTAKVAAQTAQTATEGFKNTAQVARDAAIAAELQADLLTGRGLYDKIVNIDFTMSPYTIDDDLNVNTLFIVNDSAGNVTMILPLIANTADHVNWKTGIVKASTSGNTINIATAGGNTINMQAGASVNDPKIGMLLYANAPTDWKGLHFMNATVAADALPIGGLAGDILIKNSATNSDATWRSDSSIINALIFG